MGKKDQLHEIHAIIEITQKIQQNDIAYFSKSHIPYLNSPSYSDYQRTVLHMAVWYNKADILSLLLTKPEMQGIVNLPDCVHKIQTYLEQTALFNAFHENDKYLNQETPLHLAFFDQKLLCAIILIEKGAKFDLKNCIKQRPIDVLIGKKEKQIKFLEYLAQTKLPDSEDHINMMSMIKRKISNLNKLTQSDIEDCSEILPTRSEAMMNSVAIGLSRRIVQMQQSNLGDMECSMLEEIPIEAHPRPILEFQTKHVLKSFDFQTNKGISCFFNQQK